MAAYFQVVVRSTDPAPLEVRNPLLEMIYLLAQQITLQTHVEVLLSMHLYRSSDVLDALQCTFKLRLHQPLLIFQLGNHLALRATSLFSRTPWRRNG